MVRQNYRVRAVVVNYNSAEDCLACVDSLSLSSNGVHDLLVVDSASAPSDRANLENGLEKRPEVGYLPLPSNQGFGAALNRAVAELKPADSDVLLLCNADLLFSEGSVPPLVSSLRNGSYSLVSPRVSSGPMSSPRYWHRGGRVDPVWGWTQLNAKGRRFPPFETGTLECSFVPGAALALTAETFRVLGGFREDLFLYFEDTDFCQRLRQRGLKIGCVLSSTVWHRVGGSQGLSTAKSADFFYYMSRNRLLVFGQGKGFLARLILIFSPYTAFLIAWAVLQSFTVSGGISAGLRGLLDGVKELKNRTDREPFENAVRLQSLANRPSNGFLMDHASAKTKRLHPDG